MLRIPSYVGMGAPESRGGSIFQESRTRAVVRETEDPVEDVATGQESAFAKRCVGVGAVSLR